MNYASVFLVFILACAAIFWYISGRKNYTGPVIEAEGYDSNGDAALAYDGEKKSEIP